MIKQVKQGFTEYVPGEWYYGADGVEILLNASYMVQKVSGHPEKYLVKDAGSGQSLLMTTCQLQKATKLGFDLSKKPEYTAKASGNPLSKPTMSFGYIFLLEKASS